MQKGFIQQIVLAVFVLVVVGMGAYFFGKSLILQPQLQNSAAVPSSLQTPTIKSIRYNTDCSVKIALNTGKDVNINPSAIKKKCDLTGQPLFNPQISADGKYGAFELWMTEGFSSGEEGTNNSVFVYFADHNDWINIYSFGAAGVQEMAIDREGSLRLTVGIPGDSDRKRLSLWKIAENFDKIVDPQTKEVKYSDEFPIKNVIHDENQYVASNNTQADVATDRTIYKDESVTFSFPSRWMQKPIQKSGSEFTQEFTDSENKLTFTFSGTRNYNQQMGKPYATIDEFIGLPYKVKVVYVDGQEGRQALPRAGSENVYAVDFFSKDLKSIYRLSLKVGDNPSEVSEKEVAAAEEIFNQIIFTFKFLD